MNIAHILSNDKITIEEENIERFDKNFNKRIYRRYAIKYQDKRFGFLLNQKQIGIQQYTDSGCGYHIWIKNELIENCGINDIYMVTKTKDIVNVIKKIIFNIEGI